VRSVLCTGSDPLALVGAYRDALGLETVYVADLDAIAGAAPAVRFYREAACAGIRLWVDAGVRDFDRLRAVRAAGAAAVVVATETLPGPERLREFASASDPAALVFGLDLRAGRSVLPPDASWCSDAALDLVAAAHDAGLRRVLVLDLAQIGSGRGLGTCALASALKRRFPDLVLAVGGGVSGPAELRAAARAGADAVLVGSALHDGRINRGDLRQSPG
jgi:phosphoribosylformimino-5-aminoimidazole carboxamide ribotide isomerase